MNLRQHTSIADLNFLKAQEIIRSQRLNAPHIPRHATFGGNHFGSLVDGRSVVRNCMASGSIAGLPIRRGVIIGHKG